VGRQFFLISATIALSTLAFDRSFAQGPGQHSHGGKLRHFNNNQLRGSARARLYQLSPEERQTFKRNAERWLQMNPEQRNILREREKVRRQQMKNEAEAALRDSGIRVDPNARDQFESRYFQERKRIEHNLRQEVEAKRQQQLNELNERLKHEFQSPGTNATISPGETSKPEPSKQQR
jgi:hypothetical protein